MSPADSIDGPAVTVNVNGETQLLGAETCLAELLRRLGHEPESVAVAVNGDFVPRASRCSRILRHGDQVACFKPIVGG
ncbi:sulfur carrier protein ThiS [Piscinibacter sp.]|jgi:sulfur carrier protein|uniref:sulfur carrier protein ThiS n=1 Tax=Piscinibacter sp. TaxID=1903157 RepID=UPI00355A22C6